MQAIYENARSEALEKLEPPSWALERIHQYGIVGLFPDFQNDFPFILYSQSVPRPAWSGKTDFHRDRLHQVYQFLLSVDAEIEEDGRVGGKTIFDAFEASGYVAPNEASVGVDHCLPVAAGDVPFSSQGVE